MWKAEPDVDRAEFTVMTSGDLFVRVINHIVLFIGPGVQFRSRRQCSFSIGEYSDIAINNLQLVIEWPRLLK